jgi:hypothetical protein
MQRRRAGVLLWLRIDPTEPVLQRPAPAKGQ